MSDRSAEDLHRAVAGHQRRRPHVVGHTSRSRGRRVVESERELGDPATLTEEDVLAFLLKELEPFVER